MEPIKKVDILPPARVPSNAPAQKLRNLKLNHIWVMKAILNRLKEASSWAGVAILGGLFGLEAEESNIIWQVVTAIAAAVAIFLPENGETKTETND
jgi:hypothetical protein